MQYWRLFLLFTIVASLVNMTMGVLSFSGQNCDEAERDKDGDCVDSTAPAFIMFWLLLIVFELSCYGSCTFCAFVMTNELEVCEQARIREEAAVAAASGGAHLTEYKADSGLPRSATLTEATLARRGSLDTRQLMAGAVAARSSMSVATKSSGLSVEPPRSDRVAPGSVSPMATRRAIPDSVHAHMPAVSSPIAHDGSGVSLASEDSASTVIVHAAAGTSSLPSSPLARAPDDVQIDIKEDEDDDAASDSTVISLAPPHAKRPETMPPPQLVPFSHRRQSLDVSSAPEDDDEGSSMASNLSFDGTRHRAGRLNEFRRTETMPALLTPHEV